MRAKWRKKRVRRLKRKRRKMRARSYVHLPSNPRCLSSSILTILLRTASKQLPPTRSQPVSQRAQRQHQQHHHDNNHQETALSRINQRPSRGSPNARTPLNPYDHYACGDEDDTEADDVDSGKMMGWLLEGRLVKPRRVEL